MMPSTNLSNIDTANPTYLLVSRDARAPSVVPLTVGASVFVGSGASCRVQVLGDSVQQLHCMFQLQENNVLKIQDWNTGATFLNDKCVSDETQVNSGDVITVGQCRLTAVLDAEFHHGFAVELLSGGDLDIAEELPVSTDLKIDPYSETDDVVTFNVGDSAASEHDQVAEVGFKYDFDADLKESSVDKNPSFESLPIDGRLAFDEVGGDASMSIEVEQLRFELADRDAQIMVLKQEIASLGQSSTVDESDTVKLVSRLEDLLVELESSDERVQGMEELLRVAEQAAAAEREERSQIDKWLTEVEKRVGQREAESQAEIDSLARQVQAARQDAGVMQTQLASMESVNDGSENNDDALAVLNKQVEVLRASLQEAQEKNHELLKRPVLSDEDIDLRAKMLAAKDELAKFRLEASKERAEMARRHAELESIRDELELRVSKTSRSSGESDARLRAMREHLRDIHAEEKAAKAEQKSNSLGGRIATLLNRLR